MRFEVRGLLFDLDGTLVNSFGPVRRAWARFAEKHSLDIEEVMRNVHGRRSVDTIRLLLPEIDAEAENAMVRQDEASDTDGVVAVAGAIDLLKHLPATSWAVVTSGTSDVGSARIKAARLPMPAKAVYGEEIQNGKPDPEAFLLGAKKLGLRPEQCLVFEDTEPGVQAAKAAGMKVIGIAAVSGRDGLKSADVVVEDFRSIAVTQKTSSLFVLAWP